MTLKEAAEALNLSKNGVKYLLATLHPDGIPKDDTGVVFVSDADFAVMQERSTSHAATPKRSKQKAENKPLKASETVAKELQEAKQEAKQANARTVEAMQEAEAMKGELEQLRPLKQTVDELRKERDTAKAELSGAESDRDAMTDAYTKATEEVERLRTRCTELKADVERLEGIREALVRECLEVNASFRKMSMTYSATQAKLADQAQRLAGLALQKQGFGARLKALFAPKKTVEVSEDE